jgi:hypothetical protein
MKLNVIVCICYISDRPHIYSSDSDEGGYDSEQEDTGAKRLMKAKKVISDDEVNILLCIYTNFTCL